MTTKQINDLISFVAMNAMDGVDNKQAAQWIAEQNLDKDNAKHLQRIIDNIAAHQQYIATIWTYSDDRYYVKSRNNESFNDFQHRVSTCYPDPKYYIEFGVFTAKY